MIYDEVDYHLGTATEVVTSPLFHLDINCIEKTTKKRTNCFLT